MFSGAIYPIERLLVEKHHEAVLPGNLVHKIHEKLVLVVSQIGFPVNRGKLELVGCHLIMACLDRNPETVATGLKVTHELCDPGRDCSEIMVIQLLVLRGSMTHQGSPRDHQVRSCGVEGFIHEEIFLFPAKVGKDFLDLRIKETADRHGRIRNCLQSFFERSLVVKGLSSIGNENGRDTEGVIHDEYRRSRIPCSVASGLESRPDASVGERGGVRFLLRQGTAVEFLYDSTLPVIFDEGIVFFRRTFRERLEPVGHMGDVMFQRPFLHAFRDPVSGLPVQWMSLVDALKKGRKSVSIKILAHLAAVENEFSKIVGRFAFYFLGRDCLFLKGFLDQIKSVTAHNYL